MVDRQFSDPGLAALYDALCPWEERDDLAFYLPRVMSARAVLDVGCGTGMLLHRAREAGHTGRLCGLDPGHGMLARARTRQDVEWVLGDLSSAAWDREFDLVVMTGHAFQVLVTDDALRASLTAVRKALTDDGRFGFETRNPPARAWERWTPDHAAEVTDASGARVRREHRVETPVDGDGGVDADGVGLVSFTSTYSCAGWDRPQVSRSTLRFLDVAALSAFLSDAGLVVEEQYGDWTGRPLTDASPEIITIARRA